MSTVSIHDRNRKLIAGLRHALYNFEPDSVRRALNTVFAPDAAIHLTFPFEDMPGPGALLEKAWMPLLHAIPDLERRDVIVMVGEDKGEDWIGCGGFYSGVFEQPWLDIPPTQHIVAMRYHEFFRVVDDRVVEMQAVWDIPQVMMQARAWPLTPSLGVEWLPPGPATQDGIVSAPHDPERAAASRQLVSDMLAGLGRSTESVEAMQLERYWHPRMNWYGPSGIGTARRVSGFRRWHQIPFLKALPDREVVPGAGVLFGDGDYVGYTGWPGMRMTVSGDGWLGIAPSNQSMTMRSLDFWRCEHGLIRENWVLIDLLHVYNQLGVDVFSRMRELTYDRQRHG